MASKDLLSSYTENQIKLNFEDWDNGLEGSYTCQITLCFHLRRSEIFIFKTKKYVGISNFFLDIQFNELY